MKAAEGKIGRVFVMRLEDGDGIPDTIEKFAAEHNVLVGFCLLVGGVGSGDVVVGPRDSHARPPAPMHQSLVEAHEVAAVGVLAPSMDGKPVLHMHGALGRAGDTVSGCLRKGVKTWLTGEVILYEVASTPAVRVDDPSLGFSLLEPLGVPARPVPSVRPAPVAAVAASGDGRYSTILYLLNADVR